MAKMPEKGSSESAKRGLRMPIRSDGNGDFLVKKWAALVGFVLLLSSLGYSFALTFEIGPLKARLDKVEAAAELNRSFCTKIEVHFEYISKQLEKLETRKK